MDLKEYRDCKIELRKREEELERLRASLFKITSFAAGVPRSKNPKSFEDKMSYYLDKLDKHKEKLYEYIDERMEIETRIYMLPQKERDALILYYVDGMTIEQAAEEMDCGVSTFKRYKRKAYKNFYKNT